MTTRGFTLVEMLVVIAIIAALAGLLFPTISYVRNKSAVNEAGARIELLKGALGQYQTDFGDYPPSNLSGLGGRTNGRCDGIESLIRCLSTRESNGPYFEPDSEDLINEDGDRLLNDFNRSYMGSKELFEWVDPWMNPYVYLHHRDYDNPDRSGKYPHTEDRDWTAIKAAVDPKTKSFQGYGSYQIWSFGPDGINDNGGGDDITSW